MTTLVTKAVFDTNILVSGQFWKGPPYRCLVFLDRLPAISEDSDSTTH